MLITCRMSLQIPLVSVKVLQSERGWFLEDKNKATRLSWQTRSADARHGQNGGFSRPSAYLKAERVLDFLIKQSLHQAE